MPKVVLIVEDAEFCAATLEILFGSIWNVKIMTASSGEQAWELLRNPAEPIGAMVTDLNMPGMDGFELIDRVRADANHAGLPIMVITGSIEPDVPERLLRRGVDAVFAKPYSPALVREKLEQLIDDLKPD
jgi:two-component system chemotaxis response regulator CheY